MNPSGDHPSSPRCASCRRGDLSFVGLGDKSGSGSRFADLNHLFRQKVSKTSSRKHTKPLGNNLCYKTWRLEATCLFCIVILSAGEDSLDVYLTSYISAMDTNMKFSLSKRYVRRFSILLDLKTTLKCVRLVDLSNRQVVERLTVLEVPQAL